MTSLGGDQRLPCSRVRRGSRLATSGGGTEQENCRPGPLHRHVMLKTPRGMRYEWVRGRAWPGCQVGTLGVRDGFQLAVCVPPLLAAEQIRVPRTRCGMCIRPRFSSAAPGGLGSNAGQLYAWVLFMHNASGAV